jgi:acetolactate synthase-1/3 small subunit
MEKHVLSLLVENNSGVLSRIAGLFSRRGYNIDSLSVGETENKRVSRMTIVVTGDDHTLEQIKKQLNKLIDTIKITEMKPENTIMKEVMLLKLKADASSRTEIIEASNIFRAKIIDVSLDTITVELLGDETKIAGFLELLKNYPIVELIRSGMIAIERG